MKTAGFISTKWMNGKKRDLRKLLATKLRWQSPADAASELIEVEQFFKGVQRELEGFGLNSFAEQSVRDRVDGVLRYIEAVRGSLNRFAPACNIPYLPSGGDPLEHIVWQLRYHRLTYFEKWVTTVGDALRYEWQGTDRLDESMARRILAKATPEELAVLPQSDDLSNRTINLRQGFFARVDIEKLARRNITRTKLDWDPVRRLHLLFAVLADNYSAEALNKQDFLRDFNVGDMRVVIVDPSVDTFSTPWYARRLVEAKTTLERYGLGKLWYGTLFVKSKDAEKLSPEEVEAYRELGYASIESRAGYYHSGADVVVLTNPPGHRLVGIVVHELGHRYWFKFMTPEKRARFNALVQTNESDRSRDFPSGKLDDEGRPKPVSPVSEYGWSSIEEAFAEAFERLILGEDLDRDQVESLRSVFAALRTMTEN